VFTHSTGLEIVISLLSTPNSNHSRSILRGAQIRQ
jgi:hypothetical protein